MKLTRPVSGAVQILIFDLAAQSYGVDIRALEEVLPIMAMQRVPDGPSFLEGLVNLRGETVPVVDLARRFDCRKSDYRTYAARILAARVRDRRIGFIVDGVDRVRAFDPSALHPPAAGAGPQGCVSATVELDEGRIIQVLAADRLLTQDALETLSRIEHDDLGG